MSKYNPLLAVCTILMQTLFIAIIILVICISENINSLKTFLPFANLIIIFLSILTVISIKQIEQNSRREMENILLRDHLKQVEDLVTSLHTQRHEHTRHIQTVQSMLYLDEVDEARNYLDGITDHYQEIQDLVYAGSPALTALLNSKRKVAEVKHINFDFAVKCDINRLHITPWELCSLIGNLLDNALEAAVMDTKSRRAGLEIKYENSCFMIYVYNSGTKISESDREKMFEPGFTTKTSAARGFGLYLVKLLVDKYRGSITLVSVPRTTFIISFPDRGYNHNVKKYIPENGNCSGISDAGG